MRCEIKSQQRNFNNEWPKVAEHSSESAGPNSRVCSANALGTSTRTSCLSLAISICASCSCSFDSVYSSILSSLHIRSREQYSYSCASCSISMTFQENKRLVIITHNVWRKSLLFYRFSWHSTEEWLWLLWLWRQTSTELKQLLVREP